MKHPLALAGIESGFKEQLNTSTKMKLSKKLSAVYFSVNL